MSKKKRAAQNFAEAAPEYSSAVPQWILPGLVSIYVVLTLLLIARVPLGAAPDEGAHFDYVAYVAKNANFPVFQKVKAPEYGYEFHQPPLYYALCAPFWKIGGEAAQKYLARGVSMVCGALTLILLWHAVLALFSGNRLLAALTTGFAALWPLHQSVGAAGSNDALAGLCCAGVLWAVARGSTHSWQWRDSILVGLFFGLGMLAKSSSLTIGLAGIGAAFALASHSKKESPEYSGPSPVLAAASAIGVTAIVCGWWLARNQMLYGDPLAAGAFNSTFGGSSPGPALFLAAGFSIIEYLRALFLILFCTFWGIFGGPETARTMFNPFGLKGPQPGASTVIPFMLICAAVTVITLIALFQRRKTPTALPSATRSALIWWGVGAALVALALIQFNLNFFQAQARYLHPALMPIALAFGLGWQHKLVHERSRFAGISIVAFAATLVIITLWNVFGWRTLV